MVDSGYPNLPRFLAPYKSERYGISEFTEGDPVKVEEWFNKRHASLRNVIERCFGVLKARFPILRRMPHGFSLKTQKYVPIACCTLHNFIREYDQNDITFQNYYEHSSDPKPPTPRIIATLYEHEFNISQASLKAMADCRRCIAIRIARHEQQARREEDEE